jgi:hypothetical protein
MSLQEIDQAIKELDTSLPNKSLFVDLVRNGMLNNKSFNKDPLQNIMFLDKHNYNFTQKQFDEFITAITYGKYNLLRDSRKAINTKIILTTKIMFSKFMPNEKQMTKLINSMDDWHTSNICDPLMYRLTKKQRIRLIDVGYDVGHIYILTMMLVVIMKSLSTSI